MNVALIASSFHPHIGGVEEVVRQLAHQQTVHGDRPLIVTNRWPKDLPAQEEFEGVPVRRFVFRVPERSWKQMGGALLFEGVTLRKLCTELVRHRVEIIHVHCVSSNAYYALKAKRKLNLPLVLTLHGELTMDASGLFQRSKFAQELMNQILHDADAITACSAQTLQDAQAFLGKPLGERGRVIYNGIKLSDFCDVTSFVNERPYIFGIGRFVKQKGFDLLLHAFAEVVQDDRFCHDLFLAGDGEERENLERLAKELHLERRVRFVGKTDRKQTIGLFTGCSFFVLPSRQEPLGIVNMEAMAAGKAVLATNVGGVSEIVKSDETGLIVAGNSVQSLSEGIRVLSKNTALCQRLGNNGRERVAQSDWSIISKQYTAIYDRVIRKI